MTRLVLVRHGESNATVERRIGGFRTCTGLSELGHRQAEALAERLKRTGEIQADVLVTSNFARARQTAEHLAPVWGLPLVEVAGVGEHDPGPDVDGMTFADYVAKYPDWKWGPDPYQTGFVGGETVAEFHLRVGTAISKLTTEYAGKTIVVACHGGVVDAVFRQLLHTPLAGGFELHTLNTAITEFLSRDDHVWRLIRYNDWAHAAGLPAETPPSGVDVPEVED